MRTNISLDYMISKSHSNEANSCLGRMIFIVEMDREVDHKTHYISPGGYEITIGDSDVKRKFDFMTTYGTIMEDKKSILFELREFDYEFSDSIDKFNLKELKDWKFTEFFIFTGEYDDPEINPVKISRLTFIDREGLIYETPESVLQSANDALTS